MSQGQPWMWETISQDSGDRSDSRKERILRAALEVFAERGFHQTLIDDVARAAGVGKGTIYLYVPDKETLFLEAIQHQVSVHESRVRKRVCAAQGAVEKLFNVMYLDFENLHTNAETVKVLMSERAALGFSPSFQEAMAGMRKLRKQLITSIMEEGQAEGILRNDVPARKLALAFQGLIGAPMFDILFDDGPLLEPVEAAERYLDLFLNGCGTQKARAGQG